MQKNQKNILSFENNESFEQINDEDLKNLFMGLLKLVKNTCTESVENKYKCLINSLKNENKKLKNEILNLKNNAVNHND